MRIKLIAAVGLLTVYRVHAHEGGAVPSDVWTHWNLDPVILTALLLPLYLYQRGAATYRVASWRSALFVVGILTLAVALLSPLASVSHALFSGHMMQHLLLVLVAAPLLVFSQPVSPLLRGLPINWRKPLGKRLHWLTVTLSQRLTAPGIALVLHLVALWLWHLPGLYSAALDTPFLHGLEHNTMFFTAILFWASLRRAGNDGIKVLAAFLMMMGSGLLGALMTFSSIPWYTDHIATVDAWGLTPLADQQLAGVLMWIPMGTVYVVAAAVSLAAWLHHVELRVKERERMLLEEIRDG